MKTKVKTIFSEDPAQLETKMNEWLSQENDIEIKQILPLTATINARSGLLIVIVYSYEGWK